MKRTAPKPRATGIVRLAILDTYGVRWSAETFARDIVQNFFDATPDFRRIAIDLDRKQGTIEVRGPGVFDLDYLAYIGATTKDSGRTVGGFGEGFKICALVGVRDLGLRMTAGSGPVEIEVFLDRVKLGRELCYRVRRSGTPNRGSFVRLEGCAGPCFEAFSAARGMFRHPDNPKLRPPIAAHAKSGAAVLPSPLPNAGEIYYRRQLRGRISFYYPATSCAVTLAHDAPIDAIEGDRDRRDVPEHAIARAIGAKLAPAGLYRVFLHLMPLWEHGHLMLASLLSAAIERKLRFDWPAGWLARSEATDLCRFAERQGLRLAGSDFAALGMPTPEMHYRGGLETRAPTGLERARLSVLRDLYADLRAGPAPALPFEVFDDPAAVLGQHLGTKVIVAAKQLAGEMHVAAGTVLHELAHETGGEEEPTFLNRLRRLLAAALSRPERVLAARDKFLRVTEADAEADAPAPAPGETEAYKPEQDESTRLGKFHGVTCELCVPPGFPPTAEILAALDAAAEATGETLFLRAETVHGPAGAECAGVPGVPSLWIGGFDPDPPADAEPGWRVRTYGASRSLVPDAEKLRAAIRAGRAAGRCGEAGLQAYVERGREAEARFRARRGLPPPAPPIADRPSPPHAERDFELGLRIGRFAGHGYGLEGLWERGKKNAGARWVAGLGADARPIDEIWRDLEARLWAAITCARVLRRTDPGFDDADAFDRAAMCGAQGAAVSGFAQTAAGDPTRAEADYRAVRETSARVLELRMPDRLRHGFLEHLLNRAGLEWMTERPEGLDRRALEAAFAADAPRALAFLRGCDEGEGYAHEYNLQAALKTDEERAPEEKRKREAAEAVRATNAVRRAYESALAESADPAAASARALAEVERNFADDPLGG